MRILGCDVSTGRTSESVFLEMAYTPGAVPEQDEVEVTDIKIETLTSLPEVVDRIGELEASGAYDLIGVDGTGFGRGAVDYLMQQPFAHKVVAVIANTKASREWEDDETRMLVEKQFANFKTRVAMEARKQAYRGRVKIRRVEGHERLVHELGQYKLTRVGGRWKMEDPKTSPDVGDAFIIAYSLTGEFCQTFWFST